MCICMLRTCGVHALHMHAVHVHLHIPYFLEISLRQNFIQGSIWCGDNLRAATFLGRRLRRSTRTHIRSFNNKPSCMHVKCACTYGNCCRPLIPCREISRVAFIGTSGQIDAVRFRGNTVYI